jgi:hypothetical protein
LLDNPGIWISDLLFSDRDPDSTGQAEEYLEKTFFTQERIQHLLMVVTSKFIILTKEELDLWQEDSLKFFLHMKYKVNEVKGNYLREKSCSLIAGIQLRFAPHFDTMVAYLLKEVQIQSQIP